MIRWTSPDEQAVEHLPVEPVDSAGVAVDQTPRYRRLRHRPREQRVVVARASLMASRSAASPGEQLGGHHDAGEDDGARGEEEHHRAAQDGPSYRHGCAPLASWSRAAQHSHAAETDRPGQKASVPRQDSPLAGFLALKTKLSVPARFVSLRSTSKDPLGPVVVAVPRAETVPLCLIFQFQV